MNKIRNLIYVPVIHTRADMGNELGGFQREFIEQNGKKMWDKHTLEIGEMWLGLKNRIRELQLEWPKVRVYQDGLPYCGQEKEMVKNLAGRGSNNHQLLNWLMERGANLEGCEDSKLLLNEYGYIQKIVYAETDNERKNTIIEYEKCADQLMSERDDFIRQRIDKTLKAGETALLFMGLMHRVDEGLADDIHVTYLVHRLPFKRQFKIREA